MRTHFFQSKFDKKKMMKKNFFDLENFFFFPDENFFLPKKKIKNPWKSAQKIPSLGSTFFVKSRGPEIKGNVVFQKIE